VKTTKRRSVLISLGIMLAALGLAYIPIPGSQQNIIVVSGTELQEPLQALAAKFEQEHPEIKLELKFQGSQDIVNKYIDEQNDFNPTVLIPANGRILQELGDRWRSQNNSDPFYEPPKEIAKTILVAISWSERGKVLFPDGSFRWKRLEQAMQAGNWNAIGGSANWGSFDFATTDPLRSNSGQLTLNLWLQSKLGVGTLSSKDLSNPASQSLISLIKRSVYQPPRSTDILLQEFIAKGPNDADVAMVYESIALYRWQQSATSQGKPYQIYYLNPAIETTSTAAIARRGVSAGNAKAASKFLDFLTQPPQQAVFVQYGFRPINAKVNLQSVPNSPWQRNIPGAQVKPTGRVISPADPQTIEEIKRLWGRAN
jgi:ABC-type Fe3+ transport system substrate-binding protein